MIVDRVRPGRGREGDVVSRLLQLDLGLGCRGPGRPGPGGPGEPDDAYVFVDRTAFQERIAGGGFIEWTEFSGDGRALRHPDAWKRPTVRTSSWRSSSTAPSRSSGAIPTPS